MRHSHFTINSKDEVEALLGLIEDSPLLGLTDSVSLSVTQFGKVCEITRIRVSKTKSMIFYGTYTSFCLGDLVPIIWKDATSGFINQPLINTEQDM